MAFLSNELSKLGQHLPKQRIPLSSLIESNSPGYFSKNGEFYHMRQEELEKIAGLIPRNIQEKVRLPLVFLKEKDRFRLSGNKIEAWIIEKMLGKAKKFPALLEIYRPQLTYYNYEFQRLRRDLPTLVTFAIIRIS